MKVLRCKNCSGSDLVPVPNLIGVYKCAFCGTIYQLDESVTGTGKGKRPGSNFFKSGTFLLILTGILILILFFVFFLSFKASDPYPKQNHPQPNSIIQSIEPGKSEKPNKENSSVPLTGEYTNMNFFEAYGDSMYYICIYKNTSSVRIDKPKIQISYFDENEQPIDTVVGYGFKSTLLPGESTGLLVISKKKYKLAKSVIEHFPSDPSYVPKEIKLQLSNLKLQKGDYNKYQLVGTITNKDEVSGQFISINAVLLNGNKAISMNNTYLNQKVFKPGEKSVFKIDFTIAGDKIATDYFIETSGRTLD